MPLLRKLSVNGADYKQTAAPIYDPRLSRYVAEVERPGGGVQTVYSRYPTGPFVFYLPATEEPHP